MGGFIRGFLWAIVLMAVGWIIGTFYPAPPALTGPIAERAPALAARLGIDELTMERLGSLVTSEEFTRLRREASALAARAGEAIVIEQDDESLREMLATFEGYSPAPGATVTPLAAPPPAAPQTSGGPAPAASTAAFETALALCPRMAVSNAPAADAGGQVRGFNPLVLVNGVTIAANPTRGACLSSAFGPRGRGTHKGLDYYSGTGGPILAAGDGVVVERVYRNDYGNMLLIDHGEGVFTRYAHLSSFAADTLVGSRVSAGQQIGLMGNTAAYQIPIHLHYELLLGDYANPRGSFGLEARSPFEFSAP